MVVYPLFYDDGDFYRCDELLGIYATKEAAQEAATKHLEAKCASAIPRMAEYYRKCAAYSMIGVEVES